MMPLAGKDAVLDAAPIKWETHVRAAIIESKHMAVVVNKKDGAMAAAHDNPPPRFQFLEGACAHKIGDRRIHGSSLGNFNWGSACGV
jgi:hypothetical protein